MTHDPEALAQIHLAAVRVAGRLVAAPEAEDVAQETVARALPRLTEISSYAGPWAVRVATNLSLDLLRQDARLAFAPVPEALVRDADIDLGLDLRKALTALPERQRQVVALRYLSDLDERTTAELLGISPGSVKRHLHRAVAALRTSDHLDAPTRRKAPHMAMAYDWTTHFTPAIQPEGGWPERPWDHWRMESRAGRVARVAVHDGEPVLDAEGDEVMSGPGFDYQVVKILPLVLDDEPAPERPDYEQVPGLMGELLAEALEEAHHWGHVWVGDEHLGLVAAQRQVAGVPDLATLEAAVARSYEGPYAGARVAIVHRRRSGERYLKDPTPKTLTLPIQQLLESLEGRDPEAEELRHHLLERPHSLIRHALSG